MNDWARILLKDAVHKAGWTPECFPSPLFLLLGRDYPLQGLSGDQVCTLPSGPTPVKDGPGAGRSVGTPQIPLHCNPKSHDPPHIGYLRKSMITPNEDSGLAVAEIHPESIP